MSDKLAVHFTAGRESEVQECDRVKEGENGIFLADGYNDQIGYIPYENLKYVEPLDE